jgi:hypothetical protein
MMRNGRSSSTQTTTTVGIMAARVGLEPSLSLMSIHHTLMLACLYLFTKSTPKSRFFLNGYINSFRPVRYVKAQLVGVRTDTVVASGYYIDQYIM